MAVGHSGGLAVLPSIEANSGASAAGCFATKWAMLLYNVQMRTSISAKLADIVLPEAGGAEVRLGSLWERDPAVVVFLRHYG